MWFKYGQIEVECGDGCDCGSGECGNEGGDGHAKGTSPAGIPLNTKHPPLHPIPNQSKPIVPLLSFSFIITFSYIFITISYNL
jgi:hypothetical protein